MKNITCILYEPGNGLRLVESLRQRGITRTTLHHARGSVLGENAEFDMELLSVTVDGTETDDVFEYLYLEAGIDRPRGGFIYVCGIARASHFMLPEGLES